MLERREAIYLKVFEKKFSANVNISFELVFELFSVNIIYKVIWEEGMINWFVSLEGTEYLEFATLVCLVVGGVFALWQWNGNNRIKRASFVNDLVLKIRNDKEIQNVIYKIDYDVVWYNKEFHNGDSGIEQEVDKTLSYFSYICYLHFSRLINKSDFKFFEYEIKRIAASQSIQGYLFNLYHFSKKIGAPLSFEFLYKYCKKEKLFPIEMYESNSNKFPKYLSF